MGLILADSRKSHCSGKSEWEGERKAGKSEDLPDKINDMDGNAKSRLKQVLMTVFQAAFFIVRPDGKNMEELMKAAFLNEDGMLETKQAPVPALVQDGVLVEMKVAAVCRTDLKMLVEGHRDLILPRILGHEGVGEVVESRDQNFKNGDWVGIYPGIFVVIALPVNQGIRHDVKAFEFSGSMKTVVFGP